MKMLSMKDMLFRPIISFNSELDYTNERLGLTLEDVVDSIHKEVSYWAIDESGNPSRKLTENGKKFTLSAVTALTPIDYDRLFKDVPLDGNKVHFSHLKNSHPDICVRLMTDLGNENILVLSKTVVKRSSSIKPHSKKKIKDKAPRNELYLLLLMRDLIDAILLVDKSESIVVICENTTNFRDETAYLLWSENCIVQMNQSIASRLLEVADLAAASRGCTFLPDELADSSYFEKIKAKSVNVQEKLGGRTQRPSFAPVEVRDKGEYKSYVGKNGDDE